MKIGFLAVAALLLSGADSPQEPRTLNRAQVRALSDAELSRRLFGDIGEIMFPIRFGEPSGVMATRPLGSLPFRSRPRGTARVGICESDWVTVYFDPVIPLSGDVPVAPRQLTLSTTYFVRDLRLAREDRPFDTDVERERLNGACARVDPRETKPVFARSELEVVTAVVMITNLAAAAREGRILAPTECRDNSGATMETATCLAELARLEADSSMSLQRIPGCYRRDPTVSCRRIEFDASESRVVLFELRRDTEEVLRITVHTVPEPQF